MKKIIKLGDKAPVLQASDLWNHKITVPNNGQWFFLSFHRFAACPFCNLRTNELIRNHETFEKKNIEIVSIWPSAKENLLLHAGNEKTPFPMLSDQEKRFYKAYGVTESSFAGAIKLLLHPQLMVKALKAKHKNIKVDADPNLMPASFLIDPEGIVQMAYYGKHFGDHPTIDSILSVVK